MSDEQATPEQTQKVPLEQTSARQATMMQTHKVRRMRVRSSNRPTRGSLLFLSSTLFSIITLSFV
jgi:hypothetical protein